MSEQPQSENLPPDAPPHGRPKSTQPVADSQLPLSAAASGSADALGVPLPVSQLTPEEQMALFEKELKEKDWGHQPC